MCFVSYHPCVFYTTISEPARLLNTELLPSWAFLCMRDANHIYSPAIANGHVQIDCVKLNYATRHYLAVQGAHELRSPLEPTFDSSGGASTGLRHIGSGQSLDAAQVPCTLEMSLDHGIVY